MRPVFCALLIFLFAQPACPDSTVTIVLQFEHPYSELSIGEMKAVAQTLMNDSGVRLDWLRRDELRSSESFPRLVVVSLRGYCEAKRPALPMVGEPVALGYTYLSEGEPMPFSAIECDRIRSVLRAAPAWYRGENDEVLFGGALGRVLAHELSHAIGRTCEHTRTGFKRKSLSTTDLAMLPPVK
jgi:hypothetical protein